MGSAPLLEGGIHENAFHPNLDLVPYNPEDHPGRIHQMSARTGCKGIRGSTKLNVLQPVPAKTKKRR